MPADKPTLLIVDDNQEFRDAIGRALRRDYAIASVGSATEALQKIQPAPDVVLLDLRLSEAIEDRDGLVLLETLRAQLPHVPVVIITAYGDIETAVDCMRRGAVDFLQKRADIREVQARLARALDHGRRSRRMQELERDLSLVEPRRLVGNSGAMTELRRMVQVVARDGTVTVMLRGETGTGKELVARAIHASGRRQSGPFVPVMLNAIPHSMVEAELFGHEAGAFTDARGRRVGYLERAHAGVLFLDEIGDVDLDTQGKILRFLEEREFPRLGGTASIRVDVQVVAATNADLEERVRAGKFREDLYFRLKVCELRLPALRERQEDIPLLVEHFLDLFRVQGKRVHNVAAEAAVRLRLAPWPGNVRQLRNALEAALLRAELHEHERVEAEDLPAELTAWGTGGDGTHDSHATPQVGHGDFSVDHALHRVELAYIEEALHAAGGRKSEAWRLLGYNDRETLYRRVRIIARRSPDLLYSFPAVGAEFGAKKRSL